MTSGAGVTYSLACRGNDRRLTSPSTLTRSSAQLLSYLPSRLASLTAHPPGQLASQPLHRLGSWTSQSEAALLLQHSSTPLHTPRRCGSGSSGSQTASPLTSSGTRSGGGERVVVLLTGGREDPRQEGETMRAASGGVSGQALASLTQGHAGMVGEKARRGAARGDLRRALNGHG